MKKGFTLGDIQNQGTEYIHAIVNQISSDSIKKGLCTEEICKQVVQIPIISKILSADILASSMIEQYEKENKVKRKKKRKRETQVLW
jgi:hypothetical protein